MKKTYWWRVGLIIICVLILMISYFGPCNQKLGRCVGGNSILMVRTLFHFSLAFLVVAPFLFFIRDNIFLKWLRFAAGWVFLSAIFIILAPEYSSGVVGNPTKETVSIWMGSLFVIISLVIIIHQSRKLNKNIKK